MINLNFKKTKQNNTTRPRESNSVLQLSRKMGYMCFFISFFNVLCFYLNGGFFKKQFYSQNNIKQKSTEFPYVPLTNKHTTSSRSTFITSDELAVVCH